MNKLTPGCQIAHALVTTAGYSESISIEYMRAMLEGVPTYPETWTLQEGRDYLGVYGLEG